MTGNEMPHTTPGTFPYAMEIVDLLLHRRDMLHEAALRVVPDVDERTRVQGISPAGAYALAETEIRTAWPAMADAVLILVQLSNAGLLKEPPDTVPG
ncbi:hypothetical protein [Geodermatophilus sp. URMC 62]|uniref:hypothetical protein n=1 Tax=Geodermatophilus sp. URMC 62 TaxID=3423414 RepID=UPI00406C39E9